MTPDRGQPLADDPRFLASLSELDRGLAEADMLNVPAAPPPATAAPPTPLAPLPPLPPIVPGPRPLLNLFPTASVEPTSVAGPEAAAPAYTTFYGLHDAPFDVSPDLTFLYHGAEHDRVTQQMLGAIGRRDAVVVLTGAPGVGKTTLCRALVEQLDRRTLTSFIAAPAASTADLLRTVLLDFGVISHHDLVKGRLKDATQAELMTALGDFVSSLLMLQAFAVVFLDEAQSYAPRMLEDIRLISELGGDEGLIQIVLVGQPALLGVLAQPQLRPFSQRVALRCKLGPLSREEIAGYVAHRLRVAGDHPRVEFDDAAVEKIHALTRGIPQAINLLCDRALDAGFRKSASVINEPLVDRAADDLDLALPNEGRLRTLAVALLMTLLFLAGAGVGAYVFRADLAALLQR